MNRFNCGLISIVLMGFFSSQSYASELQWATGCTSFNRADVLSLSYNTDSKQITLYRTRTSTNPLSVERFTSDRIRTWESVVFKGYVNGTPGEILVDFQTKATMYIIEGSERIQYYCDYYSFDRE